MRGDIFILTGFALRGKAFFRFLFMLLKTGVTILPSSRLARIRTGEQCSPYRSVASTARRYGGSRARVKVTNRHERNCPCPYTIAPWRIAPNEWALPRQCGYHFFWDRLNRASMALTSSGRASLAAFEMLARPIMTSADRPVRTRRSLAARSAMVMGVPLLRS